MFTKNELPQYYFGEINEVNQNTSVSNNEEKEKNIDRQDFNISTLEERNCINPKQDCNVQNNTDIHISEPNLSRIPSPTSSITSNKKLEWDSGADIGYNIYDSLKNSRKSKSYPLLTIDFSYLDEINKLNEVSVDMSSSHKVTGNYNENTSNISKFLLFTADMETFHKNKKRNFQHSTPYEKRKDSSKRKSDISHLFPSENKNNHRRRESNIKDECLQTTLIHKNDQCVQTDEYLLPVNKSDHITGTYPKKKHSKEYISSYENTSSGSNSFQYISGQDLITKTVIKDDVEAVSVQVKSNIKETVDENLKLQINVNRDKSKSADSDTTLGSDLKTSNASTNRSVSSLTSYTEKSHSSNSIEKGSSTSRKSQESNSSNSKTNSSNSKTNREDINNIPLGKIITTQHSKNLIEDIDRSLYLLQKFINSKNYNPITKKYYAKKIVTKIIQSKYSDDTSTSTSSSEYSHRSKSGESNRCEKLSTGNLLPNTDKDKRKSPEENKEEVSQKENFLSSEELSKREDKRLSSRTQDNKQKIVDTIFVRDKTNTEQIFVSRGTQCDEGRNVNTKIIQSSKKQDIELVHKCTSYDSHISRKGKAPKKDNKFFVSCGVQCDELKTNSTIEQQLCKLESAVNNLELPHVSTIFNSPQFVNSSNSTVDEEPAAGQSKHTSPDTSGEHSNKNWRDEKTISERLFEAKQMYYKLRKASKQSSHSNEEKSGNNKKECRHPSRVNEQPILNSNYLIQYSKRERRRQLIWINNEIDYLRKLQDLLQIKECASETSCASSAVNLKDEASISAKSDHNYNQSNSSKSASQISKSVSDVDNIHDQRTSHQCLHDTKDSITTNESFHSTLSEENIKKLSKYFTNEQLKILIENNTTDFNCKCMCCRYKNAFTPSKPLKHKEKTPENSKRQPENSSAESGHEIVEAKKTDATENVKSSSLVDRSCQVSDISVLPAKVGSDGDKSVNAVSEHIIEQPTKSEMKDAVVQCTITRHKNARKDVQSNAKNTSDSTIASNKSTDNKRGGQSDYLIYENMKNFNSSRTVVASTTVSSEFSYLRKKSSVSSSYTSSDKENRIDNNNTNGFRSKCPNLQNHGVKSSKPIAYLLTFEEVSIEDSYERRLNKRSLEKITVKVPRLRNIFSQKKPDKQTTNKSNSKLTLQEYLCKNRPDFVEAAEWRRQCVANAKDPHNVFTCEEMKKITLKQYKNLPEVQNKIRQHQMDHERRYNRHQANIFSKKLQKKTLQGQISLSTCISVMSPL